MQDKKKMIILAALAVVIIGVGAFQVVKSGDSGAPAPVAKTSETKATAEKSADPPTEAKTEGANPGQLASGEAKPITKSGEEAKAVDSTGHPVDATLDPALTTATKLAARDPFDGRKWDQTLAKPTPPPPAQTQQRIPRPGRGDYGGPGFKPLPPGQMPIITEGGGVPLPGTNGKMPSIDDFPYTVSGTVMGDRPCVVITENGSGKQKLVPVGGSIDGDSQVVSISKGSVTVRHRGKTKSFPVGGINPSEKRTEDKP